jgi:hypothetical protein
MTYVSYEDQDSHSVQEDTTQFDTSVPNTEIGTPDLSNEENTTPKKPKKWFLYLRNILIGVLILFFLSFVFYLIIPSPTKTVRNFFYALMNENYSAAYSYIAKDYKKSRGVYEKFASDYDTAVRSGTRTRAIRVIDELKGKEKNQRIVVVEIDVFYQGSLVTSVGAYLCEKTPGEGWKIVGNVTTEYNKNQAQKLVPQQ